MKLAKTSHLMQIGIQTMNPAILSLIFPGLGHLALGDRQSAFALMSAAAGMILLLCWNLSWLTGIFVVIAYLSLVWHSVKDAWHHTRNTESLEYVLGLAVVVGPFVLPLLWQNQRLGIKAKITWTCVVSIITAIAIGCMIYLDPMVEQLLETYQ